MKQILIYVINAKFIKNLIKLSKIMKLKQINWKSKIIHKINKFSKLKMKLKNLQKPLSNKLYFI